MGTLSELAAIYISRVQATGIARVMASCSMPARKVELEFDIVLSSVGGR